jgi:hypothetical protein
MTFTRFNSVTARLGVAGVAAAAALAVGLGGATAAQAAPAASAAVPCSVGALNAAIMGAPSDAILVLTPGCVFTTSGPLVNITRNLTIVGSNDTIHLTGPGTILHVLYSNVAISALTFTGGDGIGTEPGAIHNVGGTLSLTNVTFAYNDGGIGGAIQNSDHGGLTLSSDTFSFNDAYSGLGGAGGAVANLGGGSVSISGTSFYRNDGASGGAVANLGGVVWFPTAATKSTFTDNDADGVSVLNGSGGAILNQNGSVTVNNATFSGNRANRFGGAYESVSGTSIISGSALTGNAAGDGGAIFTSHHLNLVGDTVSGNRAVYYGGGIFVYGGHTTLSQNTLVFANFAGLSGGGIYRKFGTVSLTTGSAVTLNIPNNCTGTVCF